MPRQRHWIRIKLFDRLVGGKRVKDALFVEATIIGHLAKAAAKHITIVAERWTSIFRAYRHNVVDVQFVVHFSD